VEPNHNICKYILDDTETWMEHKFKHSDDTKAYRKNDKLKIFVKTTNQRKNQQQVKFAAYAKIIVKKLCVVNPNEATDNFAYAPSRPEKRCITVSYVAEIAPPAYIPEFMDPIAENIDLTVDEPSLLMGSVNATKLMELERSIRSIEIDR
jgi:hypothetical protein